MMAVTNPENPPHKAASFFIIPKGTPGLNIARDVFNMHHPYPGPLPLGRPRRDLPRDCRVPVANRVGAEGDGFVLAQQRLNGGRIHHAMRWVGQCDAAFDMMCERARQPRHQGRAAHREADDPGDDRRVVGRHPGAAAAWRCTARGCGTTHGASKARVEIARAQVLGRAGAPRRDRPRHPGARRARVVDGPAARRDVRARRARCASPTAPTRCTSRSSPTSGPRPTSRSRGWPSAHIPTRKAELRERFAEYLDNEAANF